MKGSSLEISLNFMLECEKCECVHVNMEKKKEKKGFGKQNNRNKMHYKKKNEEVSATVAAVEVGYCKNKFSLEVDDREEEEEFVEVYKLS